MNPSPHHDRAFHAAANAAFIAAVRAAGTVGPLTVRETPDGLELLDVHKGAWVARRAGLDAVAVRILDLDAEAYARPTARIKPTSIAGREVHELLAVSINISVGEYIRI